jgi:hypothetical protein
VRCSKGKLNGMTDKIHDAFALQAKFCRQTGSPLTARVLDALIAVMDRTTRTGARILDWPGDPMIDALKLRIAGGLNALARSGRDAELTALYAARDGDWTGVIGRVLKAYDDWLHPWLDSAPQTNEVARSGVLWPGMMEIARRFGPKLEILELGASGGLNLNMDRFAYDLGGVKAGDAGSAVRIAPEWSGPPPAAAPVEIVARAGVDLNPLDMTDTAVAERMLAYIWPDQTDRVARAEAAIAVARAFPPPVEAGDGAAWIERRLAEPQAAGVTRVVYHSVALQYFPREGRARVRATIEAAGAAATAERPLAWLSMEFPEIVTTAHLTLRCWPGDDATETLALAHPHGARVDWTGGG